MRKRPGPSHIGFVLGVSIHDVVHGSHPFMVGARVLTSLGAVVGVVRVSVGVAVEAVAQGELMTGNPFEGNVPATIVLVVSIGVAVDVVSIAIALSVAACTSILLLPIVVVRVAVVAVVGVVIIAVVVVN